MQSLEILAADLHSPKPEQSPIAAKASALRAIVSFHSAFRDAEKEAANVLCVAF